MSPASPIMLWAGAAVVLPALVWCAWLGMWMWPVAAFCEVEKSRG